MVASLVVACPAAAQENQDPAAYSNTVFFGDSTTDSGFFRPLLPSSVRPVTGQFTTNPGLVWSQYLADFFDTEAAPNGSGQTGTNYSAGGARIAINSTGALGLIPSMRTQVANYLSSNGGVADPDALYVISGGMNDIFTITNGGAAAGPALDSASAGMSDIVSALSTAGARYIMVANTHDLGLTPAFAAQGVTFASNGTALSSDLSDRVFSSLASNGLQVIPLDMLTFSRELYTEAAAFGFTNVTGTACQPQITANGLTCNPTSYITPDARNTYLYADGVHYSSRAHDIIAQYAASVLEAPRLIAQLPFTASVSGQARAERVLANTTARQGANKGWWVDVRGDWQRLSENGRYDGGSAAILTGIDIPSGAATVGLFAGYGTGSFDFGTSDAGGQSNIPVANFYSWESDRNRLYSQARGGGYDQQEVTIGGYAAWTNDIAWLHAQASYTALEFDVERVVNLAGRISTVDLTSGRFENVLSNQTLGGVTRRHAGSPSGSALALGVNAGWEFETGPVSHGPVAGVLAQSNKIDGYSESNSTLATALAYPKQETDSLLGSLGWQATLNMDDRFEPYAKVMYQREFENFAEEARARSLTISGSADFAVPGISFDRDFATATLGLRAHAYGVRVNLGGMATIGRGDGTDASVFIGVSNSF